MAQRNDQTVKRNDQTDKWLLGGGLNLTRVFCFVWTDFVGQEAFFLNPFFLILFSKIKLPISPLGFLSLKLIEDARHQT
jgi:hypothetical protein